MLGAIVVVGAIVVTIIICIISQFVTPTIKESGKTFL